MRHFFRPVPGGLWVILLVLIVSAVTIRSSVEYWAWLNGPNFQSNADTIRVIALILGGVIALILTLWRSMIADRHAKTAQLGLRNERYQKGAEMLGSETLTVRLGGIYALRRLAEEYPQEYHVQIMRLFCAFVRSPPEMRAVSDIELSLDIDTIIEALVLRNKSSVELEKRSGFCVDLSGTKLYRVARSNFEDVDFRGANLTSAQIPHSYFHSGADLSGIHGSEVDLSSSFLLGVNLRGANFSNANLSYSCLRHTDLNGTIFLNADLTGTDLQGAFGLTQAELDRALAKSGKPPNLMDVQDLETGSPLIWRGKTISPE